MIPRPEIHPSCTKQKNKSSKKLKKSNSNFENEEQKLSEIQQNLTNFIRENLLKVAEYNKQLKIKVIDVAIPCYIFGITLGAALLGKTVLTLITSLSATTLALVIPACLFVTRKERMKRKKILSKIKEASFELENKLSKAKSENIIFAEYEISEASIDDGFEIPFLQDLGNIKTRLENLELSEAKDLLIDINDFINEYQNHLNSNDYEKIKRTDGVVEINLKIGNGYYSVADKCVEFEIKTSALERIAKRNAEFTKIKNRSKKHKTAFKPTSPFNFQINNNKVKLEKDQNFVLDLYLDGVDEVMSYEKEEKFIKPEAKIKRIKKEYKQKKININDD